MKGTTKKKVYWKIPENPKKVPHCPVCNRVISVVDDVDIQTVCTYQCLHCGYLE